MGMCMRSLLAASVLFCISICQTLSADEAVPAPASQNDAATALPAATTVVSPTTTAVPAATSTLLPAAAPSVSAPSACQALKAFKDELHAAIDAALKYPAELKFRPASGVTIVSYDYAEEQLNNIRITQWSGDSRLDRAALAAVMNADVASIKPGIGTQKFHDSVIVLFDNSANTDKNTAEHKKKDAASQPCG